MAKRFTDTAKWDKRSFRTYPPAYKLFMLYLFDKCDHAGLWEIYMEDALLKVGEPITELGALEIFGNKIIICDGGNKWFIPAFIDFQYGELNPQNKAHKSVLSLLTKYNLLDTITKKEKSDLSPLGSPLQGAKDKEQDKDKELDKDKATRREFLKPTIPELVNEFEGLLMGNYKHLKWGNTKIQKEINAFFRNYESKGWKIGSTAIDNWKPLVETWIINDGQFEKKGNGYQEKPTATVLSGNIHDNKRK